MVKGETSRQPGCDGPVCWSGHHHLHCLKYTLYGHGALPYDRAVQQCAVSREPGKTHWGFLFPLKEFMTALMNFMYHLQVKCVLIGHVHLDSKSLTFFFYNKNILIVIVK